MPCFGECAFPRTGHGTNADIPPRDSRIPFALQFTSAMAARARPVENVPDHNAPASLAGRNNSRRYSQKLDFLFNMPDIIAYAAEVDQGDEDFISYARSSQLRHARLIVRFTEMCEKVEMWQDYIGREFVYDQLYGE